MDVDGGELGPSSSIDNNESNTKPHKVCWYWRRGKCRRHPCRYQHSELPTVGNSSSSRLTVKKIEKPRNKRVQKTRFYGDGYKYMYECSTGGSDNNEVDDSRVGDESESMNPYNLVVVEDAEKLLERKHHKDFYSCTSEEEDADKLFERKRLREVHSSNGDESGSSSKRVREDILVVPTPQGKVVDSANTIFSRSDAAYFITSTKFPKLLHSDTRHSLRQVPQVPRSELNAEAKHRFLEMGHILQGYMDKEEDIEAGELRARKEGYCEGMLSMTQKSSGESVAFNKQIANLNKDYALLSQDLFHSFEIRDSLMFANSEFKNSLDDSLGVRNSLIIRLAETSRACSIFANRELKNSLDESLRVRNSLIVRLAETSRDWTKVMVALLESRRENKRFKESLEAMTKERDQLKAKAEAVEEFVSRLRKLDS